MTGRLELDGLEIALAACVALVTAVSLKVGLMFAIVGIHHLVHWNPSTATKFFCTVLTNSISRVDASYRFLTLEKEALRSKRGAESVAT